MLEKFLELLEKVWDSIIPFEVIDAYQEGVVLRFGIPNRDIGPGFHWTWPLAERVLSITVVPTVYNLVSQSLTTRDNKHIAISFIMTCSITNARKAMLEVNEVIHALQDVSYGAVGKLVHVTNLEDIQQEDFEQKILEEIKRRAAGWGIKIHRIQIADLVPVRAFKLINSS